MKRNLGFAHLEIINDFTAVSMAIPMLKAEHLIPVWRQCAGSGQTDRRLWRRDRARRWRIWSTLISVGVSLPGEGGHVDFAPNSEEEGIILEELRAELGHVSAERVLSGPGLVNLYPRDCQIGRPTAGEPAAA
ncbi:glucokinase [Klebsiella pneumoniae]|uniref:Glucokinase n=1 Tax=Klebsiella pneumoniae TaxID=573 RepID=A0A2X1SB03_KLEPN|nr:glucokinase [Klebsiella pneumoniae]